MANAAVPSRWNLIFTDDPRGLTNLVEEILNHEIVGVHFELWKHHITIVEVAAWNQDKGRGTVYIFDVQRMKGLHELHDLLTSTEIVKVVHESKEHNNILDAGFGIRFANIFDIQVAHTVIKSQRDGQRRDSIESTSLTDLCQEYGVLWTNVQYNVTPEFWRKRPLTSVMKELAMAYSLVLIPLYFSMNPLISDQSAFDRLMAKQLRPEEGLERPEKEEEQDNEEKQKKEKEQEEKLIKIQMKMEEESQVKAKSIEENHENPTTLYL